jgi:hypothetical protein
MTDEDSQFVSYFADNFEKFLFQCAFSKYERLNYDKCIIFAGSPNMLKEAIKRHNESDAFGFKNFLKHMIFKEHGLAT